MLSKCTYQCNFDKHNAGMETVSAQCLDPHCTSDNTLDFYNRILSPAVRLKYIVFFDSKLKINLEFLYTSENLFLCDNCLLTNTIVI